MSRFFVWDKNRSQKSIGSFLLLLMFGICLTQGICYFSSNAILNKPNNVWIENIENDKTVKLGYNSLLAKDNEILLSKESCNGNFHYVVSDAKNNNEILNFDSTSDIISAGNKVSTNSKNVYAAVGSFVWAIVMGGNVAAALASAFGSAAGLISEGTLGAMLSLIAEEGIASIGAVIGLLSASEALIVGLGVAGLA